jgi:acetyltransferase
MTNQTYTLEQLAPPVAEADVESLAHLLIDAVESGAAVSFLLPLPVERAREWWRQVIATSDPRAIFVVARDAGGIVGTVQLHPAWAPNQPHRGEIAKLIVHRRGRRIGLGRALMHTIEQTAREAGYRLLTLDAKSGGSAERLYRRLGWIHVGTIPRYALDPDGRTLHATEIFYKQLNHSGEYPD